MLNSLSYGWWLAGTAYHFNDPDHIVIHRRVNHSSTTEREALTRLNSAIICGGVFLSSDAFTDPVPAESATRLFTRESVTAIVELRADRDYLFEDLWSGTILAARGTLSTKLAPSESAIFLMRKAG
jgi:hypothetical protein